MFRVSMRSLAGFAVRLIDLAELDFRLARWTQRGAGLARGPPSFGNGVQLTGSHRGFLGVRGAHGAQEVSRLQAPLPGELVALAEVLAEGPPGSDVERRG